METIKLNGWQHIGIALSIVLAFGAAFQLYESALQSANSRANLTYKVCANQKLLDNDSDLSSCNQDRENVIAEAMTTCGAGSTAFCTVTVTALALFPFGLFAAFILISVIRAQIIGFRAVIPWAALSWSKKSLVVLCVSASLLVAFGCAIELWGLYTETRVPVSLDSLTTFENRSGFVTVVGTWTRTDLIDDTIADPLQTSKIECDKQRNRCTEAKASVIGNVMTADLEVYEIESWTPASIAFRREDSCSTTVFTIDLNTKTVTGAGHLINQDTIGCKMNFKSKENWSLLLANGFKVYWEQLQKARPRPLKVIHALFW